jgi:hypothetical protein
MRDIVGTYLGCLLRHAMHLIEKLLCDLRTIR